MTKYSKINNILGWSIFIIASIIYLFTIEQTVSFWDCGEYISTAYKLEVGHPPGAPLFQLLGRIFSLFATAGTSEIAIAINALSALCSSFTILFLFWTITAIAKKLFPENEDSQDALTSNDIAILGAGIVGSLAYAVSDSFWFSAVEGEVYAMSSFFTAITFWCITKWEREADSPSANRWLILIAYLIGLSIGVHLLSLLTIPAMGMIYYFKKYKATLEGSLIAFFISVILLGLVQGVVIPGAVSLISSFEIFFVNTMGSSFNIGTIVYFLSIASIAIAGIYYSIKNKNEILKTSILSVIVLLIGYSSFAVLVVRSNANPPIDENNPEDAVGLLSYLLREQYGTWPKPWEKGAYFTAQARGSEDGSPRYEKGYMLVNKKTKKIVKEKASKNRKAKEKVFFEKEQAFKYLKEKLNTDNYKIKDSYIETGKSYKAIYNKEDERYFQRMWSYTQPAHKRGYRNWVNMGVKRSERGKYLEVDERPNGKQNLKFFLNYQIGWSYFRYFMWNFAGRQNDYKNMNGNSIHGNWESGITFLDNLRLGTPSDAEMPDYLKNNKAKNHYYFLPLLLGLLGMYFHFKRNKKDAIAVLLFFLFTGILIIVYLNVTPEQPRERDYAYVGSFYAFAIWIGIGVLAIYDMLRTILKSRSSAIIASIFSFLIAPLIMGAENWDDHDRSNRYTALEVAKNYLNSCEKDKGAIIFTNGDNDTFPLWYAQEVEGIRTDVKVVNLSLFNTPWYVDQMKRATYDAPPIPSTLNKQQYRQGQRDVLYYRKRNSVFKENETHASIKTVMRYISQNGKERITFNRGQSYTNQHVLPAKKLKLKVDKEKAKKIVAEKFHDRIVDEIRWSVDASAIQKNQLMVFDILANFDWDRPIYFASTVGLSSFMGLEEYFQLDGLAYRFVPYKTKGTGYDKIGNVDTDLLYNRLMNDFKWGGFDNPDLWFDETNHRMIPNFRAAYSRLAKALVKEGNTVKAIAALNKCMEEFPKEVRHYDIWANMLIETYYDAGATKTADSLLSMQINDYIKQDEYLYSKSLENRLGGIGQQSDQLGVSLIQLIQEKGLDLSAKGYEFTKEDDIYYQTFKATGEKEIVSYEKYRISTFMQEDQVKNLMIRWQERYRQFNN
jgi:hypothetical protein